MISNSRIQEADTSPVSLDFGSCGATVPIEATPPVDAEMQRNSYAHSIFVRRFTEDDIPGLYAAARESVDQLCSWMTWCSRDYSIEDSRSFVLKSAEAWESGEEYSFAIIDAKDQTFLGSV